MGGTKQRLTAGWACVFAFVMSGTPSAVAITEQDVLQKGLSDPDLQSRLEALVTGAEAAVDAAGHWDNPSIEYSREDLDLQRGASEETTIWLRQRINIAGVHGLNKHAAEHSLAASQYNQAQEERDWSMRLRLAFYQALAAQQRSAAVAELLSRLKQLTATVRHRAERGDASRFDVLRMSNELAVLSSDFESASADHRAWQATLFALINMPVEPLEGGLLPPSDALPPVDLSRHPQLQALGAEQRSAESRAEAERRARWPELTLSVGRKELSEPGIELDGNTFAVGVEIPLFDRGQGHNQVAQSRAYQLQADQAILRRQLSAEVDVLETSLLSHYRSAGELNRLNSADKSSLSYLAEISYQAGELTVMELLDAYQSDLATAQRLIAVSLQARLAYIQLQQLHGE